MADRHKKQPLRAYMTETRRPETLTVGANMLAGTDAEKMLAAAMHMISVPRRWDNPFGNGDAARRIIEVCKPQCTGALPEINIS